MQCSMARSSCRTRPAWPTITHCGASWPARTLTGSRTTPSTSCSWTAKISGQDPCANASGGCNSCSKSLRLASSMPNTWRATGRISSPKRATWGSRGSSPSAPMRRTVPADPRAGSRSSAPRPTRSRSSLSSRSWVPSPVASPPSTSAAGRASACSTPARCRAASPWMRRARSERRSIR